MVLFTAFIVGENHQEIVLHPDGECGRLVVPPTHTRGVQRGSRNIVICPFVPEFLFLPLNRSFLNLRSLLVRGLPFRNPSLCSNLFMDKSHLGCVTCMKSALLPPHSFCRIFTFVSVLHKSTCPSRAVEGRCCAAASGTADALGEPAGVEAGGFAVDRTVERGVHRATARVSVGTSAVITTTMVRTR